MIERRGGGLSLGLTTSYVRPYTEGHFGNRSAVLTHESRTSGPGAPVAIARFQLGWRPNEAAICSASVVSVPVTVPCGRDLLARLAGQHRPSAGGEGEGLAERRVGHGQLLGWPRPAPWYGDGRRWRSPPGAGRPGRAGCGPGIRPGQTTVRRCGAAAGTAQMAESDIRTVRMPWSGAVVLL